MTLETCPAPSRAPRYSRSHEVRLLLTECLRDVVHNLLSGRLSVCTVWPTPPELSKAMLDEHHLKPGDAMLELGSGTGPVTAFLDEHMPQGCRSLSIELHPRLHAFSKARLPHMNIVHGNAMDLKKIMHEADMPQVQGVISGLPCPSIPDEVLEVIFRDLADQMPEDGVVTNITALAREKYMKKYGNYFEHVEYVSVPHFPYIHGGYYTMQGNKQRRKREV